MNEQIRESDRELLEAAAKAAGKEHYGEYDAHAGLKTTGGWWNPLTDDGDAFRLAVKCLPFYTLRYSREDWEKCGEDGYAATRRAIVRAAAEIGRSMV
jgi:hypothetical protein